MAISAPGSDQSASTPPSTGNQVTSAAGGLLHVMRGSRAISTGSPAAERAIVRRTRNDGCRAGGDGSNGP